MLAYFQTVRKYIVMVMKIRPIYPTITGKDFEKSY